MALICCEATLVPLVFDYSLDVPFTVSKALVTHALAYALTGVMAALVIRFGRSVFPWSWLHVPVIAFLLVAMAATAFAVDGTLALYGTHVRMLGLGTTAAWVVLYFAVVSVIRTRSEVTFTIGSLLAGAAGVLAYELIQLVGRDPLRWTLDSAARPFSTIGQPTALAQYLTSLALGVIALVLFAEGAPRRLRALGMAVGTAMILGAAATGTRSAIVGMAAGAAALAVITWRVHPSRRARPLGAASGILATAVLAGLLLWTPLGARLAVVLDGAGGPGTDDDALARLEPSLAGRLALYEIAGQELGERPLLGYGPDNFVVGVPKYRSSSEPREIQQSLATSAHSWVGFVATSSGLLGLFAFAAIVGVALALAVRAGTPPPALAAAVGLVAFLGTGLTTVSDVATDWMFWFYSGVIAATTVRRIAPAASVSGRSPRSGRRQLGSARIRSLAAVAVVAVGVLYPATALGAWSAARAARDSANSRLVGRVPQAIERGLAATQSDPGRAEYWHVLGLAYAAGTRWPDAGAAFDHASRLAPHDVRHLGDSARVQLVLASNGDNAASARAAELAESAVRVDPNNPLAQLTKAVVMQSTGNMAEALRAVDRALTLDPGSTNDALWVTAVQIRGGAGRSEDAVRTAREGLSVFGSARRTIPLRLELARALVAAGRAAEALAELDAALKIQPNEPSVVRLRALIADGTPR